MFTVTHWIHVMAAALTVGGIAFLVLVLLPSLRFFNPEQQELFLKANLLRFRWLIWGAIAAQLVTGLIQVQQVWETPWGRYWTFLVIKVLMALVVFIIVVGFTLPLRALRKIRARRDRYLSIALGLALIIILISAYLRRT